MIEKSNLRDTLKEVFEENGSENLGLIDDIIDRLEIEFPDDIYDDEFENVDSDD